LPDSMKYPWTVAVYVTVHGFINAGS